MPTSLLNTKLYPPPLRARLIRREGLMARLDQGLEGGRQLTLVSAPAGYGKTTLARAWLEGVDRPYAWLALDRSDNYPAQFLAYLVAALQRIDTRIGQSIQAELQERGWQAVDPGWLTQHMAALINDIASLAPPFVLVLDDYQLINDVAIHEALGFLLDHQPANLHLVITTRQDPMLRLSAYRTGGLMTEVRLGDLRFTAAEVEAFLNEALELALTPEQVAALAARTEGWIAGLHLAGISLSEIPADARQAGRSRTQFIAAFTGDDRYVMDYLMDEVLSREGESVQRFLLYTSILKQLCGPLCDAVVDEGDRQGGSQAILERLEHSNLFIIPLDNHRQWYRYHHLFGDLLFSRLQSAYPERLAELHCRASEWYEKRGITAEAIDHALLAEDSDRALRLIEHNARSAVWSSGDLPALLNWSRRLPEDAMLTRPRLSLYYARALFFAGSVDAAANHLSGAERALRSRPAGDPQTAELWGVLHTNQATFAAMHGEVQAALAAAQQASQLVGPDDGSAKARVGHAVGTAHWLAGRLPEAQEAFAEALRQAQQAGNRNISLDLAGCLALTLIDAGRLEQARQVCADVLTAFPGSQFVPQACSIYLAEARAAYEQDDLDRTVARVTLALELANKASWTHILWRAYALLAEAKHAQGDRPGVQDALWQLEQVAQRYHIAWITRLAAAHRARLALLDGDLALPEAWAEGYRQQPAAEILPAFEELTLARLLLAQDAPKDALAVLDRLAPPLEAGGCTRGMIENGILRTRALWQQGQVDAARQAIEQALALAVPGGVTRPFHTDRAALAEFLAALSPRSRPAALERLFAQPEGRQEFVPQAGVEALIESLSERELEVLRLIADGMSNPEIAARLYLSVNTLRAHCTNIYRKLDVHNRVQAISRAQELGLIAGNSG